MAVRKRAGARECGITHCPRVPRHLCSIATRGPQACTGVHPACRARTSLRAAMGCTTTVHHCEHARYTGGGTTTRGAASRRTSLQISAFDVLW